MNFEPPMIEMHCIELVSPVELLHELDLALKQGDINSLDLQICEVLAIEILSVIAEKGVWMDAVGGIERALYLCALAVQFVCLAFLSYSRAHTGALRPFFLSCQVQCIDLYGTRLVRVDRPNLSLRLEDLTCMGDMTQDSVLVFRISNENQDSGGNTRYNLFASPEDLMDTWGPGQFVKNGLKKGGEEIYAIHMGGGTLTYSKDKKDMFHWSPGIETPKSMGRGFGQQRKILVGTAVTVNKKCQVDSAQQWLMSAESLENIGVFQSTWNKAELQVGIQSGQFAVLQFNQTWIKSPGSTLKMVQLTVPGNFILPFLQSEWGLQVSLCTSVARRVPLRQLIADVMPAFVESLFPVPSKWVKLKVDYKIIEAFQGPNIQEWLKQLDAELQDLVARIVRDILLNLQQTGIDKSGGHFVIAWIQKNKPLQCFKAPCERDSYWARILADSEDCATFAYITSRCLETEWLKCRGPQAT